jgi:hypothetical protein
MRLGRNRVLAAVLRKAAPVIDRQQRIDKDVQQIWKESAMTIEGGCYCGKVRYKSEGPVLLKAECLCRECQYITGGGSLHIMAVPLAGFALTKGAVKDFQRSDIDHAVTRQFCPDCGTHLFTRAPALKEAIIIKVGSLDDLGQYEGPDSTNFACDARPYHRLPTDIPVFQKWGR